MMKEHNGKPDPGSYEEFHALILNQINVFNAVGGGNNLSEELAASALARDIAGNAWCVVQEAKAVAPDLLAVAEVAFHFATTFWQTKEEWEIEHTQLIGMAQAAIAKATCRKHPADRHDGFVRRVP